MLVGLGIAVTLVPALLAVLGRWAFWPGGLAQHPTGSASARPGSRTVRGVVAGLGDRRIAALAAVVVLAALGVAAVPLLGEHNAVSPAAALPAGDPVRQAASAASAGFAPGILSPTEVLVAAQGIAAQPQVLAALATELNREPGAVSVLGPGDQPLPLRLGLFVAPDGGAARFLVVFDADPLGATAIANLRGLQRAMPGLLGAAGLSGAHVDYAGDTALGLSLVDQARADLGRVALAVGLVDLLLLTLFLRALVAPLYLLACSGLAVGASLGLTTWLFQDVLGVDGLIFYVPFAAGVLLVSLGSDYNIFSVGYVWEQARRRPLAEALAAAVPQSTRAISAAGATLAVSFAFVALVPVAPFRELAFAMAAGVLIDAFLVRSLLVPALISLVGRASGWPGNRLRRDTGEGAGAPQGR